MEEFEKASCIWGLHVYQDNWTPILGKRLVCDNGPSNPRDRYALAVCKAGDNIVGHLPRNILTMCSIFIPAAQWNYLLYSFRETAIFRGSSTGWDGNSKNSLENFCNWRLICENRESFPPWKICIIQYILLHKWSGSASSVLLYFTLKDVLTEHIHLKFNTFIE